jgi:hypothetical protein
MKMYFYPDKGEQKLIFEINSDCAPNIGDTLIIYSICYIVVNKTFYYNNSMHCCVLYLDKANTENKTEKIKL